MFAVAPFMHYLKLLHVKCRNFVLHYCSVVYILLILWQGEPCYTAQAMLSRLMPWTPLN